VCLHCYSPYLFICPDQVLLPKQAKAGARPPARRAAGGAGSGGPPPPPLPGSAQGFFAEPGKASAAPGERVGLQLLPW